MWELRIKYRNLSNKLATKVMVLEDVNHAQEEINRLEDFGLMVESRNQQGTDGHFMVYYKRVMPSQILGYELESFTKVEVSDT